MKERSMKYKLWATYSFHLRSTADLRALGFLDVPTYYAPPSPSKTNTDVCNQTSLSHTGTVRLLKIQMQCLVQVFEG